MMLVLSGHLLPAATAVLLLSAAGAAAQPRLSLAPDTLVYPGAQVVTATNLDGEVVTLDSLVVAFGGPRAWHLEVEVSDTLYDDYYLNAAYETSAVVGLSVEPGATALLRFAGFDPCIVCKAGWPDDVPADTLLVYSGGGGTADTILIDLTTYVSREREGVVAERRSFELYPNPARGVVYLRVEPVARADPRVELFDVMGRVVERPAPAAGSAHGIDLGSLAPGIYFVRVTAGSSVLGVRRLVVAP